MFNGLSTEDMCIDYKLKFGIRKKKLPKGDIQLGMFINRESYPTYGGTKSEYYLHITFFKWCISIGWFLF